MGVTLSEAAARHVTRYIAKRGKGVGVRLGVKTTGCSGLAYKLEYADAVAPEDHVFEEHGVKVLVDPKSLPYIDGTQLDFVREGLNEGFKFHNPKEKTAAVVASLFESDAARPVAAAACREPLPELIVMSPAHFVICPEWPDRHDRCSSALRRRAENVSSRTFRKALAA